MDMAIGYLLLENLALDAVLSGGSWGGTLDYALDPRIESNPARAADKELTSTKLLMSWEDAQFVTELVICGHTAELDDRFRVTAYEGETELLQTEWTDFFGRIYDTSLLPWEQSNWFTGKPRARDITGYAFHRRISMPLAVAPTSILLEVDARLNSGDFDIGYIFAGNPLLPAMTYTWGRELGIRSNTLRARTAGGRQILTRRVGARTHRVTWPHLTKGEAMRIYDVAIREDIHPVIFVPDPADNVHEFREVFPAWMTVAAPPRQMNELGEWAITVTLEEMQG